MDGDRVGGDIQGREFHSAVGQFILCHRGRGFHSHPALQVGLTCVRQNLQEDSGSGPAGESPSVGSGPLGAWGRDGRRPPSVSSQYHFPTV